LPTTVWYPATGRPGRGVAERASAAPGPFPLVLFSHGLTTEPGDYREILVRWVEAGFVVAAPAYPHTSRGARDFDPVDLLNQPADASQVISDLLKRNARAGDPLRGRIDPARIAAAGHSGGGVTTVGLFAGNRDDRLDAGIVLAGRQLFAVPFTGPPAPVLFVHGRRDTTVQYAAGLAAFRSVPWPRALLTITAGGHVTTDRDSEVTVRTTTEFLRWSLYGDPAAKARIPKEARRGGVASFTDEL
jgi:dienelactone hydrolase